MVTIESLLLLLSIVGLLFTMAYQINSLLRIKKHNLVLYRLRATQDELVISLVDNLYNDSLSIEDKLEIRGTIEKIENLTTFFHKAKERFTFRMLSKVLFITKDSPFIEREDKEINPILVKIRRSVSGSLLFAFSQYVPFFKLRLIMHFFSVISELVIIVGMKEIGSRFDSIKDVKRALDAYNKVEHTYHEYQTCEV